MTLTLNVKQQLAVDTALAGHHTIVKGPPGTGKTKVMKVKFDKFSSVKQQKGDFLTYSRLGKEKLYEEIGKRPNVRTVDGKAWSIMSRYLRTNFNDWKPDYERHERFRQLFAARYWSDSVGYSKEQLQSLEDLKILQMLVMANVTDYSDWKQVEKLASDRDMELTDVPFLQQGLATVMKWVVNGLDYPYKGRFYTLKDGYEFSDLHYVIATNPDVKVWESPVVMCDEIQDLSEAQWQMLQRVLGANGQFIGFGDPKQSIYFFRGVRSDMFGKMVNDLQAQVCPMSVSYRLSHEVIKRPAKYDPLLQADAGNPQGAEVLLAEKDILGIVRPGMAHIALTNAQGIKMAYFLIRQNLPFPVIVKGRNIGKDMTALLAKIMKDKAFRFDTLPRSVEVYEVEQRTMLVRRYKKPDRYLRDLQDEVSSLVYLFDGAWEEGIRDTDSFIKRIETLFQDNPADERQSFVCLTAWKAKGLEYPAAIVEQEDMDSVRAGCKEEVEQHKNAIHVALTRQQETRYILKSGQQIENPDLW